MSLRYIKAPAGQFDMTVDYAGATDAPLGAVLAERKCWKTTTGTASAQGFRRMSASPPKADMCGANRHVCFGPKADIAALPPAVVLIATWYFQLTDPHSNLRAEGEHQ